VPGGLVTLSAPGQELGVVGGQGRVGVQQSPAVVSGNGPPDGVQERRPRRGRLTLAEAL
jgi:hypothetical protein